MSANPKPSLLLVGINGYGRTYVNALLDLRAKGEAHLAAIVDPTASRCEKLAELTSEGAPVYDHMDEFVTAGGKADLAFIASPIQFHCEQTCAALNAGISVLCEKPLGAQIAEADRMEAAEKHSGNFVAIGYQFSFSKAVLSLKEDIIKGRFGAPKRFKTIQLNPRDSIYYARNNWAGKVRDHAGRWVLDSPANNANAHFLHNMLFLLGDKINTAAMPAEITAELARANDIENFDTCNMRVKTRKGAEVLFYTSHAVEEQVGVEFVLELENGEVSYKAAPGGAEFIATLPNGETVRYGDPTENPRAKVDTCIEAWRNPGAKVPCGVAAARAQTHCIEALSKMRVRTFENEMLGRKTRETGGVLTYAPGMADDIREAYEKNVLPSDLGSKFASEPETRSL